MDEGGWAQHGITWTDTENPLRFIIIIIIVIIIIVFECPNILRCFGFLFYPRFPAGGDFPGVRLACFPGA